MYRQQQFRELLVGKRILIAGYGREGQSTHALLRRLLPDVVADVAHDDEEIFALLEQQCYDVIIKSPGIPTMRFEGRCELDTITSQTDLFLQVYGDCTIGVTGTKGKSTTATLIHHVLSHSLSESARVLLAGNIGIPLFDIIDQLDERSIVVAELSCHQLENIHRAPHIGVILNLYQEHLDHYHDYRGYQMAKMRMMLKQQAEDHCFYCTDSDDLTRMVEAWRPVIATTLHPYSLQDARQAGADRLQTTLQGDHNVSNIFVAKQVCALMGVTDNQFASALASFKGLPHRLELVGTYHGITFYNDSISTIPQATIRAIEALQSVDTLIIGGYDRGIDYGELYDYFLLHSTGIGVGNIVFVGEAGKRMYQEMLQYRRNPLDGKQVLLENDYAKIVDWCFAHTHPGKTCLLSPAAASYDSFKNFEERGNTFKELIRSHK